MLPESSLLREAIKAGPPFPIRTIKPNAPQDLVSICEKAMAHPRTTRYQSILELSEEFRAWTELRPVLARKPGPLLKLQKWMRRNFSLVLGLCAVCLITSVAFFLTRAS